MENIFEFEGRKVEVLILDEVEYFNLEDVAIAIGQTETKNGKCWI